MLFTYFLSQIYMVCVSTCVHTHMLVGTHTHEELRLMLIVFLSQSHPCSLRQNLSHWNPYLIYITSLSSQLALRVPCLCLLSTGIMGGQWHLPGLHMGSGYLNSGPQVYVVSILPMESSNPCIQF